MSDSNIQLSCPEEAATGLVIHPTESNRQVTMRALRLAAAELSQGASLAAALAKAGTTAQELARGGARVRAKLEELRGEYTADAATIRELVTLTWTQKALDEACPKVQMVALRELSLIPEVGLKGQRLAGPQVEVLSPETQAVLDSL